MSASVCRLSLLVCGALLAAIAAACSPSSPTLPTEAPLAELQLAASATPMPPATSAPHPTATVTPSLTSTASATATSTSTPLPTASATSTVVPTPSATPQPTACAAPGRVEAGAFASATTGSEHRYTIYLPPCYGADGRNYPVLYLLAGNIHDETKWNELGMDEAANVAILEAGAPPLLIVMPEGGWIADNTSGGPGSYESVVLNELIPHIEAGFCAWAEPAGRAIGGISRGGYWALEIAFRFPHLFTSVGGHSAALLDQFAGPAVNPQFTGLNNDLGGLRVYLDIGDNDHVRINTIRLHEEMAAAGVAHEWHLNEGQHVDAYWTEHIAEYLAWYVEAWSADRSYYPSCTVVGRT